MTGALAEMAWDGVERTDSGRVVQDSENDIASQIRNDSKDRQQQFSDFISKPTDNELKVLQNVEKGKDIIIQVGFAAHDAINIKMLLLG